jgi:hypothetical protein
VRCSYEGWCGCVLAVVYPASTLLGGDCFSAIGGGPLAYIMYCPLNCTSYAFLSCAFLLFFLVLPCVELYVCTL